MPSGAATGSGAGVTSVSFVSGFGAAGFGFGLGLGGGVGAGCSGAGVVTTGLVSSTTGAGCGRRACCAHAASSAMTPNRHARNIDVRMRSVLFAPGEKEYKKVSYG